jgi:hypothetical protein
MSTAQYRAQVALVVRILPLLASEPAFALKGGTAINLFWRDLPRLSVDLDLTYRPLADRLTSLAALTGADRTFLMGGKTGQPDWSLVGVPQAAALPAVQWRLTNARRQALADRLKDVLEL